MIDTYSPHLNKFSARGGKLITWHGLADELIPPDNTISYYKNVLEANEHVDEFYRVFLVPGTLHCVAGNGPHPDDALQKLMKWVEDGEAPEVLKGTSLDGKVSRPLCPWPKVARYDGKGDQDAFTSFSCADSY